MTGAGQRVAIITGGSQGIGAGLVAAYRRRDWAVVANSRTIKPSEDGAVLTISGDISEPATTDRESRRGESHPPPLAEPCGSLSAYTAPIVQPSGLRPNRQ